jgi:hypothetical protein
MPDRFVTQREYDARHSELRAEALNDASELRAAIKSLYEVVNLQSNRLTAIETVGKLLAWVVGLGFPTFGGVIVWLTMRH